MRIARLPRDSTLLQSLKRGSSVYSRCTLFRQLILRGALTVRPKALHVDRWTTLSLRKSRRCGSDPPWHSRGSQPAHRGTWSSPPPGKLGALIPCTARMASLLKSGVEAHDSTALRDVGASRSFTSPLQAQRLGLGGTALRRPRSSTLIDVVLGLL